MNELECMSTISTAIESVEELAARERIVTWLVSKYGVSDRAERPPVSTSSDNARNMVGAIAADQIPGIAKLSQAGEVQLTIRDLKAKSANDAAIRLVHVLVWATAKLTNNPHTSSRHSVLPWLKKYRCYDGNTRGALAQDKGIVREGDLISLDFHAEQRAEGFVAEILDGSVEGKWKPGVTRKRNGRSIRQEVGEAL